MRDLVRPGVLRSAVIAAAATTLLCLPRYLLWEKRSAPVWYLEAMTLLGASVLWGFVFAWHEKYSGQPELKWKIHPGLFTVGTLVSVGLAIGLVVFLDPVMRRLTPEDYPVDIKHWLAMVFFNLGFAQLLLVFAPVAWLLRLFENKRAAMAGVVLLSLAVLIMKTRSSGHGYPSGVLGVLAAVRILMAVVSAQFYLRGGMLLVWWCGLLIESRLLTGFFQ